MQEELRARLPKYQRRKTELEPRSSRSESIPTNSHAVTVSAATTQQQQQHQHQQAVAAAASAVAAFQDQQQRQQAALSALQQQQHQHHQQQQQQRYSRPPQMMMPQVSAAMPVSSVALMGPLMRPTMTLAAPALIHGGNMMRPPPMGLPPGKSLKYFV